MSNSDTTPKLAQPFGAVKPDITLPPTAGPKPMAHHKVHSRFRRKLIIRELGNYGVPSAVEMSRRVISPQGLLKWFNVIQEGLRVELGLTPGQRLVVSRLLRYWAYYGAVYPKASQVAGEPEVTGGMCAWRAEQGLGPPPQGEGVSKRTFWRTVALLEEMGLLARVNRYVIRPHAQISNLYLVEHLIYWLARYIAQRREFFCPRWLEPILRASERVFWAFVTGGRGPPGGEGVPA